MQSNDMKRLEELTEMLPEFPDSDPPPIPEWLRARGLRKTDQKETEVRDE